MSFCAFECKYDALAGLWLRPWEIAEEEIERKRNKTVRQTLESVGVDAIGKAMFFPNTGIAEDGYEFIAETVQTNFTFTDTYVLLYGFMIIL